MIAMCHSSFAHIIYLTEEGHVIAYARCGRRHKGCSRIVGSPEFRVHDHSQRIVMVNAMCEYNELDRGRQELVFLAPQGKQ